VDQAEVRIAWHILLDVPGLEEPGSARLVSLPGNGQATLNALHLRSGRLPDPDRPDEVVVIDMFARANHLHPGDFVEGVINGRRRRMEIVGTALSPEHVYSIPPASVVPDDRRHAVIWMNERALAAACNMEGAFNEVTLRLGPRVREQDVIARLDSLLARFGGLGAHGRDEQVSHWFLENEFQQLRTFGFFIPVIFLGVAAFLLNVVLSRLVSLQREQIAALKAFGYSNTQVGFHYLQMVGVFLVLGGAAGMAGGRALIVLLLDLYRDYYHFPSLKPHLPATVPLAALALTAAASLVGARQAVRRAITLPPAEAMRPESPISFRPTLLERWGLQDCLSPATRMILRQLERHPLKSALTVLGLAFAVAILVMGAAWTDIIRHVIDIQTRFVHREDMDIILHEPSMGRALHELASMEGVRQVEGYRTVPVRIRWEHRQRRAPLVGLPANPQMERPITRQLQVIPLPEEGMLLSRILARKLGVQAGDPVEVDILEGRRPTVRVPVVGLVDDLMGVSAYMEIHALNRLLHEGNVISGAKLLVDEPATESLLTSLRRRPRIQTLTSARAALENLRKVVDENLGVMILVNGLFAFMISSGVIYNAARVSLSERSRELASLRVLGLTRGEVRSILVGELALLTLLALPPGFLLGHGITAATLSLLESEVMRFPFVIHRSTYALATLCVGTAAAASSWIVCRRLDQMDLVEVLKSRE
jgi:putative ABC transport system permease protein